MRRDLPQYYPNSDVKITDPFFVVKCPECGKSYWSVTPIKKCSGCGSENPRIAPANDKASQENA